MTRPGSDIVCPDHIQTASSAGFALVTTSTLIRAVKKTPNCPICSPHIACMPSSLEFKPDIVVSLIRNVPYVRPVAAVRGVSNVD